jgi:hypothetical protein
MSFSVKMFSSVTWSVEMMIGIFAKLIVVDTIWTWLEW